MTRGVHPHGGIDASRILPGLYQGARPPTGSAAAVAGFDVIVLTAQEYQPSPERFTSAVVLCPLDDHPRPLSRSEWRLVLSAAKIVASEVRHGATVLVSCWQGLNRSGLVCAVAVMMLTGCSGKQAVDHVRRMRPGALSNQSFANQVSELFDHRHRLR